MNISEIRRLQIDLRVLGNLQANQRIFTQSKCSGGSIQVPRNNALFEGALRMWGGETRANNIDTIRVLFESVFLQVANIVQIINDEKHRNDKTELYLTALDSLRSLMSLTEESMGAFDALIVTYSEDQYTKSVLLQMKENILRRKKRNLKLVSNAEELDLDLDELKSAEQEHHEEQHIHKPPNEHKEQQKPSSNHHRHKSNDNGKSNKNK